MSSLRCGSQEWILSSNLHGSGAHVGEDLFSGSGILIITESSTETLLHDRKAKNWMPETKMTTLYHYFQQVKWIKSIFNKLLIKMGNTHNKIIISSTFLEHKHNIKSTINEIVVMVWLWILSLRVWLTLHFFRKKTNKHVFYLFVSYNNQRYWHAALLQRTDRCQFPAGHRAPAAHQPVWS